MLPPDMPRRCVALLAMLAMLLPASCGGEDRSATAMAAVEGFQNALRAGDEGACRALVTRESAAALSGIPWGEVSSKQPLMVLGAEPRDNTFHVQVADPNEKGRRAEFVVVREYGRFVVDLVASAGLTAQFTERPSNGEFVPRELSAQDFDRIRRHELAQPPR